MSAEPAKEKISFWLKIIQDSRYSDFRRRECLFELFRRYVVSGMPVNELQRLKHVLKFSSSNLTDVSPFAIKTPIRSRNTGSIYMFQNALLAKEEAAIYLKLSTGIPQSDLLQILQGGNLGGNAVIQEVGISRPDKK